MQNNRSIGVILLALFLLVFGILAVTNITFAFAPVVEGLLAIGAAIFLFLGR